MRLIFWNMNSKVTYVSSNFGLTNDFTDHCAKSVRTQSFPGPYFPAFGLNKERYSVSLHIQSECRCEN